jgi:hypothetical protein
MALHPMRLEYSFKLVMLHIMSAFANETYTMYESMQLGWSPFGRYAVLQTENTTAHLVLSWEVSNRRDMQLSADLSGAFTSNIPYSFITVPKMVKSHV